MTFYQVEYLATAPASMGQQSCSAFSFSIFNIPVLFLCWAAVLGTEGRAFLGKSRVGAVCVAKLEPQFPAWEVLYSCPSDSFRGVAFLFRVI